MEFLLAAVVLAVVAWFVTAPFRRAEVPAASDSREDPHLADLEARKEAKYREIRDAELDRAQGKLSEEDWREADAELRREALAILEEIDRAGSGHS